MSLHLSKCHIVGNHISQLIYSFINIVMWEAIEDIFKPKKVVRLTFVSKTILYLP